MVDAAEETLGEDQVVGDPVDAEGSELERTAVCRALDTGLVPGSSDGAARGDSRERLFRGVLDPDGGPDGDVGDMGLEIQREERFLDLLGKAGLPAQGSSGEPTSRLASESTSASGAYLLVSCRAPSSLSDGSKRGRERGPFAVRIHEDVPGTFLSNECGVFVD